MKSVSVDLLNFKGVVFSVSIPVVRDINGNTTNFITETVLGQNQNNKWVSISLDMLTFRISRRANRIKNENTVTLKLNYLQFLKLISVINEIDFKENFKVTKDVNGDKHFVIPTDKNAIAFKIACFPSEFQGNYMVLKEYTDMFNAYYPEVPGLVIYFKNAGDSFVLPISMFELGPLKMFLNRTDYKSIISNAVNMYYMDLIMTNRFQSIVTNKNSKPKTDRFKCNNEQSFINNQVTGGEVISEKPIPKEDINPFLGLDGEREDI